MTFVFLLSILLVVLSGCEKESEDSKKDLIGKWDQVSLTTKTYYDNVMQNEIFKNYVAGDIALEILNDGIANKYVRGVLSDAFYWTTEGELLIITGNSGIAQTFEFSVSDADLTLKWAVQETTDGHLIRSDYMSIYKKQQ